MSTSRSKLIDKNRYQKSYPTLFRKPRYDFSSTSSIAYEIGEVCFLDNDIISYTFSTPYDVVPSIVVSPIGDDINIWIESITTSDVTFRASTNTSICVSFQIVSVA
jgi:hypothetical protein